MCILVHKLIMLCLLVYYRDERILCEPMEENEYLLVLLRVGKLFDYLSFMIFNVQLQAFC